MTAEERKGYVYGVLAVCGKLGLPEFAVVEMCQDLNIAAEELIEFRNYVMNRKPETGGDCEKFAP